MLLSLAYRYLKLPASIRHLPPLRSSEVRVPVSVFIWIGGVWYGSTEEKNIKSTQRQEKS